MGNIMVYPNSGILVPLLDLAKSKMAGWLDTIPSSKLKGSFMILKPINKILQPAKIVMIAPHKIIHILSALKLVIKELPELTPILASNKIKPIC